MMGPWCMAGDENEAIGILQGPARNLCGGGQFTTRPARRSMISPARRILQQQLKSPARAMLSSFALAKTASIAARLPAAPCRALLPARWSWRALSWMRASRSSSCWRQAAPWILPDWIVNGSAAILLAMFGGTEGGPRHRGCDCGRLQSLRPSVHFMARARWPDTRALRHAEHRPSRMIPTMAFPPIFWMRPLARAGPLAMACLFHNSKWANSSSTEPKSTRTAKSTLPLRCIIAVLSQVNAPSFCSLAIPWRR